MTQIVRKIAAGAVKFDAGVGPREIVVVASDATLDRAGDILEPAGARLEKYRRNPVVLAQHDATKPIARATRVAIEGKQIVARIEFPPIGTSALSDEYLRLAKAGVVGAVSVGFIPLRAEPLGEGGWRYTSWELLELSLVSVPANPAAVVTHKAARHHPRRAAAEARMAEYRAPDHVAETRDLLAACRVLREGDQ